MNQEKGNVLFPIFLKLEEMNVLLVGGGNVAVEKMEAILKNSPATKISVVSPMFREEMLALSQEHSNIELINRKFSLSDLDNRDIVFLATDNSSLHVTIKQETKRRKILTNVADTPALCDFYLSSVVRKGDLKIAISSNGKSPTITKRIREYLEDSLPDNTQELLDNLAAIRDQLRDDFQHKVNRLNEITKDILKR